MTDMEFATRLLHWFDAHGRHDLPWQHPRAPYRVWVAEVMLQQTQVATVIPYFQRFMAAFPDLPALAAAERDAVLALWSGLGYYSRARNLHRAAQRCVEQHDGALPRDPAALGALPGIGRSTAAAILAQAFGDRHAILDGNVKRVLCRVFGIDGYPGRAAIEKRLWPLAESLLPSARLADYTQAIMDFGATLCTRHAPRCADCPLLTACTAYREQRVAELPTPRPSKALPRREAHLVLLTDASEQVLMQRRAPVGIWAELWSLPQFDDQAAAAEFAAGMGATEMRPGTAIEHGFTHFHLRLTPWRGKVTRERSSIADNPAQRWIGIDGALAMSLPQPIRRLLESEFA